MSGLLLPRVPFDWQVTAYATRPFLGSSMAPRRGILGFAGGKLSLNLCMQGKLLYTVKQNTMLSFTNECSNIVRVSECQII